jgi:hypothetical protein
MPFLAPPACVKVSLLDLTFASVSPRVLKANAKSKPH